MRTSARNVFECQVVEVKRGAVNAEVRLEAAGGLPLIAIVTETSVDSLGLAPGEKAYALIKSSFVLLAPEAEVGRTSARNVLCGTVARVVEGAVNDEIVLDLGGGASIAAIVTRESSDGLGLTVGARVCALVKASHVILAVD